MQTYYSDLDSCKAGIIVGLIIMLTVTIAVWYRNIVDLIVRAWYAIRSLEVRIIDVLVWIFYRMQGIIMAIILGAWFVGVLLGLFVICGGPTWSKGMSGIYQALISTFAYASTIGLAHIFDHYIPKTASRR